MSILEIKSVSKEYRVRDVKIAAIDDLDLKIQEQEFLIVDSAVHLLNNRVYYYILY